MDSRFTFPSFSQWRNLQISREKGFPNPVSPLPSGKCESNMNRETNVTKNVPQYNQTGRKGGSFHRGASVGWASTRGCWRHQMDPFLVLSLFNAAPYLTLDECWVITPFITQITLKNYSTLKCFTTMKEIFLYQHDGKLILCLIRQLDFTLSHSQSEFPTRQETIFVLFLDWILDACNYCESGSIFMVQ